MEEFKIRIFQPIVPEYRVALFEGLAARYGNRIEVFASAKKGREFSLPLSSMAYSYDHPILRFGSLIWQRGFNLRGLRRGDVIVVCGDLHQISSLFLAVCAKARGIAVVWWGHHVSANAKEINVSIRLWIARKLSSCMLCYTDAGISYLVQRGFLPERVFATGNTIDIGSVKAEIAKWTEDRLSNFRRDKGIQASHVFLFCGVLREKVRVDVLLRAFADVIQGNPDCRLVVIGTGEKQTEWMALGDRLRISRNVLWVGELRGQDRLAPWFLSADCFVYPGRIGLSLVHAYSYGLPVIVNDNKSNHGPEYSIFRAGVNGYSFRENDAGDLAEKMRLSMCDAKSREFGEAGQRYVFENLSMEQMVRRYGEAIEAAAATVRR